MRESDDIDDESIHDFIGDESSDNEIDSSVADTVLDAISNTLEDIDTEITFGVKLSSSPVLDWTEEFEIMFKIGDLVNKIGNKCVYKVVGFGYDLHSYEIKKSGGDVRLEEIGYKLVLAPKESVWESSKDSTDPLKVPGLNICCPSNNGKNGTK